MDHKEDNENRITDRLEEVKRGKREECLNQELCHIHPLSEDRAICLCCGMEIEK